MIKNRKSKECRGSVLMEFVIVAPLYFALLGGLFFIGELTLNRLRMHIGDHTGTWLGATRLMWTPTDSDGNSLRGDVIAKLLREKLFLDTMELAGRVWVDQVQDTGKINSFIAMYKGGVNKLTISLPDWARGMLFMQDAMSGQDTTELTTKQAYTFLGDGNDNFRSFSFHRYTHLYEGDNPNNPGTGKSGDRADKAVRLVAAGVLNLVGADWICTPNPSSGDSQPQNPDQTQSDDGTVTRVLSEWGE